MKNQLLLTTILLLYYQAFKAQNAIKYPVTNKTAVSDDYFGTKVEDPYRWLEDDKSQATMDWVTLQNQVTQNYFNTIGLREVVRKRLKELWNYSRQSAPFKKGDKFFCFKNNGLQNQSVLIHKRVLEDEGMPLLDPNSLSPDGTVSVNGISISKDGKMLAYGISKAGSDWVEIHFMDIDTRQELTDVLKWVKFSGMSWQGKGIYYSRYAEPTGSALSQKNQFHRVYYHQLGTSQNQDKMVYEDKNNPDYNFNAFVTDDEHYLFISTSKSTSGEKLMLKSLATTTESFTSVSDNFDNDFSIIDNVDNTFYMLTNKGAPNYKLVSFKAENPDEKNWKTIIPEGKSLLESVQMCNNKLLANKLVDVSSKLYCYDLTGKLEREIKLPGLCKLSALNTDKTYKFATYSISQFIAPEQTYYLDATTWQSKLLFSPDCRFESQNYVTDQVFYTGKDGTRIPMFISHKKGLQINAETPCFVYGYGGFNISITPEFKVDRAVFMENGGIYCVPNIRGGGEYGENWHKAGTKCNKQNVFNDFIAACDFLVAKKYTSYNKIAIHGRSNGGLLIGAVLTQRPDICKVALPTVGVLDMLRFHQFTIGRAWTVDYGCSDNKSEFDCLYKYSPLHNIKKVNYPATLILTGDHDDRVVPAHSFKFAATLQENNTSQNPALIRVDINAGHGAGKPTLKQIEEFADLWSFVFHNLNMNIH